MKVSGKGISLNPFPGERKWLWDRDLPGSARRLVSLDTYSLGQILGHLNSYNRATKRGALSAVNLCLHIKGQRITINEGRVKLEPISKLFEKDRN
jgi:hypothetical protein